MNLSTVLKLRKAWESFSNEHPNMVKFIEAIRSKPITEGTKIIVTFTYPDGSNIKGGINVKQSDLELFEQLKDLREND